MKARTITDLHYLEYLKILSKLRKPLQINKSQICSQQSFDEFYEVMMSILLRNVSRHE